MKKSMDRKLDHSLIALGVLLLISAIVWLWEGYHLIATNASLLNYEQQVYSHCWESVWFQHDTPPMSTILNSLILSFGKWQIGALLTLRLATMLLGFALIFLACRQMGAGTTISFFVSLGHSISSIRTQPVDWFSHDSPVYFFLPLFIWSMVKFIRETSKKWGWGVAFSAGALVMTSSVPGLVAVGLGLVLVLFQKKIPLSFARHVAPLLIPVLLIGFLCLKNYLNVNLFTLATKGGQNGLAFVTNLLDSDVVPPLALKAKLPDWWLTCYINSQGLENKQSGLCYDYHGPLMSLNYDDLRQELGILPESKLSQAISLDEADESKRPWIFAAGEAPNCGRRFNALYNGESEKIWQYFLTHYPLMFFNIVFDNTNKLFNYDGPGWMPEWLHNKNQRSAFFNSEFSRVMAVFYWISIGFAYLMVLVLIFKIHKFFPLGQTSIGPVSLMALGYIISNILLVIATCGDQPRYFWMAEPYLIPLLAWVLQWAIKNQTIL